MNLDGPFEPWRGKDPNGSNPLDRVYWPMGKDYTRAYNLARFHGGFRVLADAVEKVGWIRAVLAVPNCGRKSTPIALAMLHHLGLFDLTCLDSHPDYAKAARIAAKAIEAQSGQAEGLDRNDESAVGGTDLP